MRRFLKGVAIGLERTLCDIITINEANLNLNNISKNAFPGYIMEIDQLGPISKHALTVVLVKENISYKRC